MVREPGNNLKKGTFGTNISFDLDDTPPPVRRKTKSKQKEESSPNEVDDEFVGCPGCGSNIKEDEWVDCLVGFVSGAHEFEIGNPVRARIVQNLRNEVSRMNVPNPRDDWELAVVSRLMTEIEKIVTAEINRNMNDVTATSPLAEKEREDLIIETEQRVINTMALEIQEALIEQLTPQLELQIRAQVEQELWQQFENEWKSRTEK